MSGEERPCLICRRPEYEHRDRNGHGFTPTPAPSEADPGTGEHYASCDGSAECECAYTAWLEAEPPLPPRLLPATPVAGDVEDDGPECSNCGKADCPDADLPEFSEPRECEFASMYEAFRASKDCDYGCGRDYSMQAVRLWMVPEMERILAARLASHDAATADRVRSETAEGIAAAIEAHAEANVGPEPRRHLHAAATIAREAGR